MKKPIIALISSLLPDDDPLFSGSFRSYVNDDYIQSVVQCGGIPMIIPFQASKENIVSLLQLCDGVILPGGVDIDPLLYHEVPINELGMTMREIDDFYMEVIAYADQMHKPVLGICKGHQALNVAFKGTLYQDLKTQKKDSIKHFQNAYRYQPTHHITIKENNLLYRCFQDHLLVNSFHHQAIKDVADVFEVIAVADDGVIEAIEKTEGTYMLGVQWHPEMMISHQDANMILLISTFIQLCA